MGTRIHSYRQRRDDAAVLKRDCYVIQFRDGSLLRDQSGRILFRSTWRDAQDLLMRTFPREEAEGFSFELRRAINFPHVVAAAKCSASSAIPIATRFAQTPRPHPPLGETDQTLMKLLARARQTEGARAVAHDFLLEHYPEYRGIVAQAGRASRQWLSSRHSDKDIRVDQIIWLAPGWLVETLQIVRRNPVSQNRLRQMWDSAVRVIAEPHGGPGDRYPPKAQSRWIPIFRVPAARPNSRPSKS